MQTVAFTIQGEPEAPETGTVVHVEVASPVTLASLRAAFPFEGTFHFRQRMKLGDAQDHVWVDLTQPGEKLRLPSSTPLEIRALPLSFGEGATSDGELEPVWELEDTGKRPRITTAVGQVSRRVSETFGNALGAIGNPLGGMGGGESSSSSSSSSSNSSSSNSSSSSSSSSHRRGDDGDDGGGGDGASRAEEIADTIENAADAMKKKAEEMMSSEAAIKLSQKSAAVGKGLSKLWSKGLSAVTGFAADVMEGGGDGESAEPQQPSGEAKEALRRLQRDLEGRLDFDGRPEHLQLLKDLWGGLFGAAGGPFVRASPKWRSAAGFTKNDVAGDMEKVGSLTLRALAYMSSTYERKARAMLAAQKANTASTYPFAFVGVNLTKMLADVLKLRGGAYAGHPAAWWGIFENDLEDAAFFELFCLAFAHIDFLWKERKATRKQFGPVMTDTKTAIVGLLNTGPSSLEQFMQRAVKAGIAH